MQVRSLGYRTDLIFSAFNGEVVDCGEYLVIRTPSNRSFYWGNFLLFRDPPRTGDFDRWRSIFFSEVRVSPEVQHEAFGWDTTQGEAGEVGPFLEAGFELSHGTVLTTRRLMAPMPPVQKIDIRPLGSDDDWLQAVENQIRCREPEHEESAFRAFKERQMRSYRSMAAAGMGEWFGAFLGEVLVADLGLFHDGALARYQTVETHPEYRRQGIAANLVYQAGAYALERFSIHTLVIVADRESAASRLYQSLGFAPREQQLGLQRRP
jgi:GNAT superfamily N-acetyltransferase